MGRNLIVLLALLLLAPAVRAQMTDADRAQAAVMRVKQGIALQQAGKHDEALPLFEQAWSLAPHPKSLFYKARSLMALKRYDEARATYLLIRKNGMDLEADKLKEVEANLALCESQVALKQPIAPSHAEAAPVPAPTPVSPVVAKPAPPAPSHVEGVASKASGAELASTSDPTQAPASEKSKSALTWWLVGGGAAALLLGSVVTGVLLATKSGGGEPAPNKVWSLPPN